MCGDAGSVDGWVRVEWSYDDLELGLHPLGLFRVTAQDSHCPYSLSYRETAQSLPLLSLLQGDSTVIAPTLSPTGRQHSHCPYSLSYRETAQSLPLLSLLQETAQSLPLLSPTGSGTVSQC